MKRFASYVSCCYSSGSAAALDAPAAVAGDEDEELVHEYQRYGASHPQNLRMNVGFG